MNGSEKLLELAKAQIGYQEKAGAVGLDDPDANAGQNNYTKYSVFCQVLFPEKSVEIPCFRQGIFPTSGGH